MMTHGRGAAVVAHVVRFAVAVVFPMIMTLVSSGQSSPVAAGSGVRVGGGVVVVFDGGGIDDALLILARCIRRCRCEASGVALAVAADDGEDEAFDGDFHGATGTAAGGGGCGAVAGVARSLLLSPHLGFAAATAAVPLLAVHGFPKVWSDQVLPSQ